MWARPRSPVICRTRDHATYTQSFTSCLACRVSRWQSRKVLKWWNCFIWLTPRAMSQPVPATCSGVTPLLLANTPLAFDASCNPELGDPGLLPGPTSTSTRPGITESGTTRSSTAHNSPLSDAETALTSADTWKIEEFVLEISFKIHPLQIYNISQKFLLSKFVIESRQVVRNFP